MSQISDFPEGMRPQIQEGLSNRLQQAFSPRQKKTASPIERALAGTNAMPLPESAKKGSAKDLEVGKPYITAKGIGYWNGNGFQANPLNSITGQPTTQAGEAPGPDELLPGEE